ncbi:GNAT family N-acetyltransferase [Paenibacillus piri]|uniref:GNAT family N-acetyltransferase n=1 Tax=Paenibacillus piri TaxID=2547395 RepID=A0A4R5KN50_9BACL|nr:GNAT family N-acetyltransferase [Paenibacillus piri]TDF96652.1 GNAT family N-acetyltransferase [Paenibacillus piri]
MNAQVDLVEPSDAYREAYVSFYEEWLESKEKMVPFVICKAPYPFQTMLQHLADERNEELLPDGWVPASTYWLIDAGHQVVGAVNIRHRLNPKLLNSGGHIGYGIRPSERRKGYATALLGLALQQAARLGISKALLCCDSGNIGSERTILKHGGVFESEYTEADGGIVRRFWIELSR